MGAEKMNKFAITEALENRKMFASINLDGGGQLNIIGDANANVATVTKSGSSLIVKIDAVQQTYAYAAVLKINAGLKTGADKITIGTDVIKPATIHGNEGRDTLFGGGAKDYL